MAEKDNSIVLVLTTWVTMPLQGFNYIILASASSLVFNFLQHSCLCCSFGLNLSSHGSGHGRAGRKTQVIQLREGLSVRWSDRVSVPVKMF